MDTKRRTGGLVLGIGLALQAMGCHASTGLTARASGAPSGFAEMCGAPGHAGTREEHAGYHWTPTYSRASTGGGHEGQLGIDVAGR